MLYIGVTGTQTPALNAGVVVAQAFMPFRDQEVTIVNGLCIGMDELCAEIADVVGFKLHGVCPANRAKVSQRAIDLCDTIEYMPPGTSYMDRNDCIIRPRECPPISILLAFPKTTQEELRSGTWATVRRGWRALGERNVFIYPVGSS